MTALMGVDVSNLQGSIDFGRLKAAGVSFAFTKIDEGTGYRDPTGPGNWNAMKAAGLARGCYHFARPDRGTTPDDEARFFLGNLPPLAPGDLVALDMEMPWDNSGQNIDMAAWALAWLHAVEQAIGFLPLIYTYPYYAQTRLQDARLGHYPLWLASYSASVPASLWPWPEVAIWQYTDKARYAGISGIVDGDQLARTLDGLCALGKPAPALPPSDKHWELTTAMHLRPSPRADAPWGPLLPVGTKVVELDPPHGASREQNGFAYVRTSGDVAGYALMANMTRYTP